MNNMAIKARMPFSRASTVEEGEEDEEDEEDEEEGASKADDADVAVDGMAALLWLWAVGPNR